MTEPFNYYRKMWHMLGLIVPVALYTDIFAFAGSLYQSNPNVHAIPGIMTQLILVLFLGSSVGILFVADVLRFRSLAFRRLYERYLGFVLKKEERHTFTGSIAYLTASTLLILFCSRDVAILCMVLLAVGDPTAAYVGGKYGRLRMPNGKSAEGAAAFVLSGLIVSVCYLSLNDVYYPESPFRLFAEDANPLVSLGTVLIGTCVAAIAESFSFRSCYGLIDDNVLVPLATAAALAVVGIGIFSMDVTAIFSDPTRLLGI